MVKSCKVTFKIMKKDFLLVVGYFCTVVLLKGTFKTNCKCIKVSLCLKQTSFEDMSSFHKTEAVS